MLCSLKLKVKDKTPTLHYLVHSCVLKLQTCCFDSVLDVFEWTELRDVNKKTRTYEDRPNFKDLNEISEC